MHETDSKSTSNNSEQARQAADELVYIVSGNRELAEEHLDVVEGVSDDIHSGRKASKYYSPHQALKFYSDTFEPGAHLEALANTIETEIGSVKHDAQVQARSQRVVEGLGGIRRKVVVDPRGFVMLASDQERVRNNETGYRE